MLSSQLDQYQKFTKDTAWAAIAYMALASRWLILLPILSKTLGAKAYGIWSLIEVTVLLLVFVALLQLDYSMARFLASEPNKGKISSGFFSVLAVTSGTSILFSILMYVLAEPFAAAVLGDVQMAPLVKLAAFLIVLTTLDGVISQYFRAIRQMAKYSMFIVAEVVGEIALITYLVLSGFGLYGAISALLIVRILLFVIGFLMVKSQIEFSKPSIPVIKSYLTISLPLVPAWLCWWTYSLSCRYIIGYFLGVEAVGVYAAAYVLATVIEFLFNPLIVVLLPATAYLYENNKIQDVKTHLKYSFKLYLLFAIPCVLGISILAKPLLATATTAEFTAGFLVVPIIALAEIFMGCGSIIMTVPLLLKRTRTILLIEGISAATNVAMNIVLVPLIGILGAAVSTLVAFILRFIIFTIVSFKQLSFDVDWQFIGKAVLSSFIMGAVIWKMNPSGAISIVISILIGAAIYFAALTLLRGFSKQEYDFLKGVLRSLKR
ncbi:MAG: polysaccharide biosynthesis C-terminal domain-containing protein [Dehalococcoidia bacterium]|nr:polysaccharide biosynthesis C-terminal domain-containing protein [Dehalococcoidia bacterium]